MKLAVRLQQPWFFAIWCVLAAFGSYASMYGFRKPFTAGSYAGDGNDLHLGRSELRIQGDRQCPYGHQAGDRDDDGNDKGKFGPFDKEGAEHGLALPGLVAA